MFRIGPRSLGTSLLKFLYIWFLVSTKTVHPCDHFLYISLLNCCEKSSLNLSGQEVHCVSNMDLSELCTPSNFCWEDWRGSIFFGSFTVLGFLSFGAYSFFIMSDHPLLHTASHHSWVLIAICGWTVINCLPPVISILFLFPLFHSADCRNWRCIIQSAPLQLKATLKHVPKLRKRSWRKSGSLMKMILLLWMLVLIWRACLYFDEQLKDVFNCINPDVVNGGSIRCSF